MTSLTPQNKNFANATKTTFKQQKLKFSLGALFHTKIRVCPKNLPVIVVTIKKTIFIWKAWNS